jgi:hypothetical protein
MPPATGGAPGGGGVPANGGFGGGGGGVPGTGGSILGTGGTPDALPDGGGEVIEGDVGVPPEPGECEYVSIRAQANATGAPFQVPGNFIDKYICFEIEMSFPGPTHALQFKPVVQNDYIHHWLLYKKKPGVGSANGTNAECLGLHPDSELLAGWAPGAGDWNLPKHVGMNVGDGKFLLEIHFNNLGGPSTDQSGVDVCVTQNLRPKTAGIHWLGTEFITLPPGQEKTEVSNCVPRSVPEPIHILKSWPHMHLLGTRMRATIYRAGGGKEPLFDVPFDFNLQYQYDTSAIINAGDSIQTWCTWQNSTPGTVLFGERTTEEMCYNFVVAYPEASLVSAFQGIHANSCQGGPIQQ